MDPEDCTSARNLDVSILEVERFVVSRNPSVTALFDVLVQLGWCQVGDGGDAQCRGGGSGDLVISEYIGGRHRVAQRGEKLVPFRNGERDPNIREILRAEGDGSFDLDRDFSGRRILPFFLLFALQPSSMGLSKFLVYELGYDARDRNENHTVHSISLHPIIPVRLSSRA